MFSGSVGNAVSFLSEQLCIGEKEEMEGPVVIPLPIKF
jgi:hypothetical protein